MPLIDLDTLTRCDKCSAMLLYPDEGCPHCRAVEAESALAKLTRDGGWVRQLVELAAAVDVERPRRRLVPLGFEVELRAGAAELNCSMRPDVAFRPEILTIDPACSGLGSLVGAYVGNRAQLASFSPLPLSLFNPMFWGSLEVMREVAGRFTWDVASIAMDITLKFDLSAPVYDPLTEVAREAMNMPAPTKLRGALWGRAEEPLPMGVAQAPVHRATVDVLDEVAATLKFENLVQQMRSSGRHRR